MTNGADKPASFRSSSCLNLQTAPRFYDCELLRALVLDGEGRLMLLRRCSRVGECVRWITGMDPAELGADMKWAMLAVPARDGGAIISSGKAGEGRDFTVAMNTFFTCMHTDSTVTVPARGTAMTRQVLYFITGDPADVLSRFRADFGL